MHKQHYGHLAIMTVPSFIAMFILMYAMVDGFANVYPNVNQFYLAGLMAAPMTVIELLVIRAMITSPTAWSMQSRSAIRPTSARRSRTSWR